MNDWSATHDCSGSESGWTMYLDQSYTSDHRFGGGGGGGGVGENYRAKEAKARADEEDEEDLSMVSDASSGPPHYLEDNEELFYNNGYSSYAIAASESAINCSKEERKKSKKGKQNGRNQQYSYLDDTASSPVYGYRKANVNNSSIRFFSINPRKYLSFLWLLIVCCAENQCSNKQQSFGGESSRFFSGILCNPL